jgi:ATP-dependent protease ClpP protease subunit
MSEPKSLNFIQNNTVFIHGDFDKTITTEVFPHLYTLIDLEKAKKQGKIKISINSNGGDSAILRAFFSFIEQAKSENIIVETIVEGKAYSCGSQLAIAGTKGHRYITAWGEHLVHYGQGSSWGYTEIDFERSAEHLKIWKKRQAEFYLYHTKLTKEQIEKLRIQDSAFLYADECIKYGLADKIIGDKKMLTPASLNIL